jgi:hypothetical protein
MYDARLDGLRALAILPVVLFHDALRGSACSPLYDRLPMRNRRSRKWSRAAKRA